VEISHWLSLASICLLGAMSPGPSLAVVLKCTLGGGSSAGLAAALAHGAGVGLYGLLTVAGLALVITRSPALFLALQLAGAAYLVYLGVNLLRSTGAAATDAPARATRGHPAREGFLVAFLNPKLAVFMLALFSQFLQPAFGVHEKALMAATVGVIDAGWYALVVALVSRPAFLDRLRRGARYIDRGFGVLLIVLALSVAYSALSV